MSSMPDPTLDELVHHANEIHITSNCLPATNETTTYSLPQPMNHDNASRLQTHSHIIPSERGEEQDPVFEEWKQKELDRLRDSPKGYAIFNEILQYCRGSSTSAHLNSLPDEPDLIPPAPLSPGPSSPLFFPIRETLPLSTANECRTSTTVSPFRVPYGTAREWFVCPKQTYNIDDRPMVYGMEEMTSDHGTPSSGGGSLFTPRGSPTLVEDAPTFTDPFASSKVAFGASSFDNELASLTPLIPNAWPSPTEAADQPSGPAATQPKICTVYAPGKYPSRPYRSLPHRPSSGPQVLSPVTVPASVLPSQPSRPSLATAAAAQGLPQGAVSAEVWQGHRQGYQELEQHRQVPPHGVVVPPSHASEAPDGPNLPVYPPLPRYDQAFPVAHNQPRALYPPTIPGLEVHGPHASLPGPSQSLEVGRSEGDWSPQSSTEIRNGKKRALAADTGDACDISDDHMFTVYNGKMYYAKDDHTTDVKNFLETLYADHPTRNRGSIDIHVEEQQDYPCIFPNCDVTTLGLRDQLETHYGTHLPGVAKKDLVVCPCEGCTAKPGQRENLDRHALGRHLRPAGYLCRACVQSTFSRKELAIRHLKSSCPSLTEPSGRQKRQKLAHGTPDD